jgi:hypothetical protein
MFRTLAHFVRASELLASYFLLKFSPNAVAAYEVRPNLLTVST